MIDIYIELQNPSIKSTTIKGIHSTWVNFEGQVSSEEIWSESQGGTLEHWSIDLHAAGEKENPDAWVMGIDPEEVVGRVSIAIDPVLFKRLMVAREDDTATLFLRFDDPVNAKGEQVFRLDHNQLTWRDKSNLSEKPDVISIQVFPGGLNAEEEDEDEEEDVA